MCVKSHNKSVCEKKSAPLLFMFPVKTGNNYGKATEPMSRVRPSVGPSVASPIAKTTERITTKVGRNKHENLAQLPVPSVFTKVKGQGHWGQKTSKKSGKNDANVLQTVAQKLSRLF